MHTTTQRKVRDDFDLTKEYSVNVKGCTEIEKKEVQQAFFDVGIFWECWSIRSYQHLDAVQYTNKYAAGGVTDHLLFGTSSKDCNMTAKEFLELVYEPEQQGHVHAELMLQYAEDAKTHTEPWKLWQLHYTGDVWHGLADNPTWVSGLKYRRKPKTHTVNGVEVPDLRITPELGEEYVSPNPSLPMLVLFRISNGDRVDAYRAENNLCYERTEEGKQAAILHSKAWLGEVL